MASILAMLIVGYQFISTSPAPPRELAYRALPSQMGSGKVARGWFVGSRHGTTVGTELRQPADRFSTVVSADQIATVDRASRGPERIDRHGWGGFTRFARILAIVDIRGALFCGILLDRSLPDRTTET
jgi:hypothetical protein